MKYTLLVLLAIIHTSLAFGSHTYGGWIEYEWKGNRSYEFTVRILTDPSGIGNQRNRITINYGNQTSLDTLIRDTSYLYANQVAVNIYKSTYTYPGVGNYVVSVTDPNRSPSITNLSNPGSQALYLETSINTFANNNSIRLFTPPHFFVKSDSTLVQNLNILAVDSDGDQLVYDLVSPKSSTNNILSNYQLPSSAVINNRSGSINWSPIGSGLYLMSVRISEVRNAITIAQTTVDFVVESSPTLAIPPDFNIGTFFQKDSCGVYSLNALAGDTIMIPYDVFYDSTSRSTNAFTTMYTNLDTNYAAFNSINFLGFGRYNGLVTLLTDSIVPRCEPYSIYLRANVDFETEDFVLQVYRRDSTLLNCDSSCLSSTILSVREKDVKQNQFINIYPNPSSDFFNVEIDNSIDWEEGLIEIYNLQGRIIDRITIESSTKSIDYQRNGLPTGLYFLKVTLDNSISQTTKIIFTDQ